MYDVCVRYNFHRGENPGILSLKGYNGKLLVTKET